MATQIKLRRDTAANWTSNNPTPAVGEPCYETDTGVLKIGDGTTAYNSLSAFASGTAADLPEFVAADAASAQAAIDLAEAAGGGVVSFADGGTLTTGLTVESDNVHLRGNGVSLTASGAVDLITLQNVKNCSVDGFRLEGGWQSGRGIVLEGALYCKIGTYQGISGDAFNNWMIDLRADGVATQNTAGCEFGNIVVDNTTRFMHFKGNASPLRPVANNNFHGGLHAISAATVDTIMFDFEAYADNNAFHGVVRIQLQRAGDIGVRYNTDATMREVYENHFWGGLLVDEGSTGCNIIDAYNTQHSPVVGYTYVRLRQGGNGVVSTTVDSTVELMRMETGGNRVSYITADEKADIGTGSASGLVVNSATDLDDSDLDQFQIQIHNDGTPSASWPNRFEFLFETSANSGSFRRTTSFNEYGEIRAVPALTNTVPVRAFNREFNTDPARSASTPIFQLMDNRSDRNEMWAVYPDGSVVASGSIEIDGNPVVVSSDSSVTDILTMTQAAYDLITPDANTLYVIVG